MTDKQEEENKNHLYFCHSEKNDINMLVYITLSMCVYICTYIQIHAYVYMCIYVCICIRIISHKYIYNLIFLMTIYPECHSVSSNSFPQHHLWWLNSTSIVVCTIYLYNTFPFNGHFGVYDFSWLQTMLQ